MFEEDLKEECPICKKVGGLWICSRFREHGDVIRFLNCSKCGEFVRILTGTTKIHLVEEEK